MNLDKLTNDGWCEIPLPSFKDHVTRSLQKAFPSRFVCSWNSHNGKIYVVVEEWKFNEFESLTIDIRAGVDGGPSVSIEIFNLWSADEVLQAVPRLIAAWEAANNPSLISGSESK